MNGFLIVGLIGVALLVVFFWLRGRNRRRGALPPLPPEALTRRPDEPITPTKPVYQMREGGDGGGNG